MVTTKEIARLCGVSRGTVDRALNNRPGVNEQTKEKILKLAEEMGYKPDNIGRSLSTGKTWTIGVVVLDVYSRFFGQLVHSIEAAADRAGYFIYLALTHKDRDSERRCVEHLISRKVDGLIIFSVNKNEAYLDFLRDLKIPIVSIVNRIDDTFDYIGIDDYSAITDSVEFLCSYGHKGVLYVGNPPQRSSHLNTFATDRRLIAFENVLEYAGNANSSENIIMCEDYPGKAIKLLKNRNHISAILCYNDNYALEMLGALNRHGYKVPEDISVMGFDNIDTLKYIKPGLTTVSYPTEKMGSKSVELLIDRITNGKPDTKSVILKHDIVVRQSVLKIK